MAKATLLGQDLAQRSKSFIERCIADDEQFHSRIMAELERAEAGDVQAVRSLVAGWRDLVTMTRANYRLDDPGAPTPQINLTSIQISQSQPGDAVIGCTQQGLTDHSPADEDCP